MDENITNQVEETETEAVDESEAAFDSGWEDSDTPMYQHTVKDTEFDDTDAQPESEDEEVTVLEDEPDEEKPEEKPAETEAKTEPAEEKAEEAGSQRFKLKFLGEDKEVSLDEMRDLAEKGMNYAHVKEERDKLRDYEGFLKELAEGGETTIDELIESTRAKMLIQKAEKEGKTLSEDEAREQIRSKSKKEPEPAPEKTEEEKRQDAIHRFISLYPGVKSEDIPQSVWDEADRVGDLIGPYQKYESQKLRDEIAKLKQNNKNRERSTGSRRTVGATTPKDAFDEGWDS